MSKEDNIKPLSDKEFCAFIEDLSEHLEHAAILNLYEALSCSQHLINQLVVGHEKAGKPMPKLAKLSEINQCALAYAAPFVRTYEDGQGNDKTGGAK